MYKWYLPTLSEIIQAGESQVIQSTRSHQPSEQAEQQWYGAIAALNTLLGQCQSPPPKDDLDNLEPGLGPDDEANTAIKG